MSKTVREIIRESNSPKFTNWVRPTKDDLALEYKIEYEIKPLKQMTDDAFPTLQSFLKAVSKSRVLKVTPDVDKKNRI